MVTTWHRLHYLMCISDLEPGNHNHLFTWRPEEQLSAFITMQKLQTRSVVWMVSQAIHLHNYRILILFHSYCENGSAITESRYKFSGNEYLKIFNIKTSNFTEVFFHSKTQEILWISLIYIYISPLFEILHQ